MAANSNHGDDTRPAERLTPSGIGAGDTVAQARPSASEDDTLSLASSEAPGPSLEPLPDFRTVDQADYSIDGELARGGMGRILHARDRRHGRPVAIKELLADTPTLQIRFRREALITARLQHPAIVPVYEAGRWPDGKPFYAMKKVEGKPLDAVIAGAAGLELRLGLLPNVIAVAEALAYAHRQRIIHRDLKPANILVGDFGETVVIDWGLAKDLDASDEPGAITCEPGAGDRSQPTGSRERSVRSSDVGLTVAGHAMGTPGYMSPEQARGEVVDERADVYSLGAILYQLLTGERPYGKSRSVHEVIISPPRPVRELEPNTPPDLAAIVAKAMARDPAERYPTAAGLADDLKRFETGQLVGVYDYSIGQLLRRWIARRRATVIIAGLAAIALAVTGLVSVRRVAHERDRAEHQQQLAEQNRREVEELLGFMLGDLRSKLEPIGKTDLLDNVAETAASYYRGRPIDWSRPKEVAMRALAHDNLAYVMRDQGGIGAALAEARKSEALRRRLVELWPNDPELRRGLARSRGTIGDLARSQGDLTGALAEYRASQKALAELVGGEDDANWRNDLARSHLRVGDVLGDQGDLDGALAAYRAGQQAAEPLAAIDPPTPGYLYTISVAHNRIGDALRSREDFGGALAEYRSSRAIRERLVEITPDDATAKYDLSVTCDTIGDVLRIGGEYAGALIELRTALRLRQQLLAIDPDNTEWRRGVSVSHGRIGLALRAQGDLAGALAEYRTSEEIARQLAAMDQKNAGWQRDLAVSENRVGEILQARGDLAGALAEFRAAKEIVERLVAIAPDNAVWRRDLWVSHDRIAGLLRNQGRLKPALAEYRAAQQIVDRLGALDPDNPTWRRDRAQSHNQIGGLLAAMGEAESGRRELARAGEIYEQLGAARDLYNAACAHALAGDRERAFAALSRAVDAGYDRPAWVEADTDLVSLRGDPRWDPLIAKMKQRQ